MKRVISAHNSTQRCHARGIRHSTQLKRYMLHQSSASTLAKQAQQAAQATHTDQSNDTDRRNQREVITVTATCQSSLHRSHQINTISSTHTNQTHFAYNKQMQHGCGSTLAHKCATRIEAAQASQAQHASHATPSSESEASNAAESRTHVRHGKASQLAILPPIPRIKTRRRHSKQLDRTEQRMADKPIPLTESNQIDTANRISRSMAMQ